MNVDKIETITVKHYYGSDPMGFYWAGSPQKRAEVLSIRRNDPAGFESVYQGRPGKRVGRIFMSDDFTYYQPPEALDQGIANPEVAAFCAQGHAIFQAWDTAFSTSAQAAFSVCVTGMFVACDRFHRGENPIIIGDPEAHFDVMILDVVRRKLDWGALLEAAKTQNHKWRPRTVLIENRATGISLLQTLPASGVPIQGIDVGAASKGERALNRVDARSAGSVQGWCRQHRVQFPAEAPWLDAFVAELKDFSGENDASSDQVDAFVHLVTHAIILSAQGVLLPTDFMHPPINAVPAPADDSYQHAHTGNNAEDFLRYLGAVKAITFDPFEGTCQRCDNNTLGVCAIHRRFVVSFDTCDLYTPDTLVAAPSHGLMM